MGESWGSGNCEQHGSYCFYSLSQKSGDITSISRVGNNSMTIRIYSPGGYQGVELNSTTVVITYITK